MAIPTDSVTPRSSMRAGRGGVRSPADAEIADSSGPVQPESLGMTDQRARSEADG